MPIDPNIILQLQGPRIDNPMDVAAKAMTMKQLANQTQLQDQQIAEQNAMRDAFQKNITMNPDGTTSLNRKAALSDLYKANPMKAMEAEKSFHQMDQEEQKMKLEKITKDLNLTGQLLGAVKDQDTYDRAKAQAQAYGLDISKLPAAYDPNYIKQMQMQTLSVKEQVDSLWKEKDFGLKEKEVGIKEKELGIKADEVRGKNAQNLTQTTTELRKERSQLPTTKATAEVSAAYNKIRTAAKDPSAAGDLSLIFGYMKILDPGSTVREGEFANAQNAAGVPTKIMNIYNQIKSGERLSPEQRQDFIKQSKGLYESQLSVQKQVDDRFGKLAQKAGADPKDVLLNFEAEGQPDFHSMSDAEIDALYKKAGGK